MKMKRWDDSRNWQNAARCFKIWDMDVRGYHKSLFRFWIKGNHVMVIGCPDSPYCELKPSHVTPVDIHKVPVQEKNSTPKP
jgi:beta-1,2-N-acetylglucosaminyltransferase